MKGSIHENEGLQTEYDRSGYESAVFLILYQNEELWILHDGLWI